MAQKRRRAGAFFVPCNLRYAAGVYNLFNWQYALPAVPYATNLMPQNGRSFIFSLTATR